MKKTNATERKKRSPIWLLPENQFIELVKKSNRIRDVLGFFGLVCKGGNFYTAKARIAYLKLDTSHFASRTESSAIGRRVSEKAFRENWLVRDSKFSRNAVKSNLLRLKLLPWKCFGCGNEGEWRGKKLSLQLEHRNGKSNDNRLENLGFLCPNCHSQTETYAGKSCRGRGRTYKETASKAVEFTNSSTRQ